MSKSKINWYKYAAPANFYPLAGKMLPWFTGLAIVLFAVGLKKTLADHGEDLGGVLATALCGGLALYLLGHVLLRLRISGVIADARGSFLRRVGRGRPLAMLTLLAFWPVAGQVPALVAVVVVAVVFVALIAYEALRYRESRSRIRHGEPITEQLLSSQRVRASR